MTYYRQCENCYDVFTKNGLHSYLCPKCKSADKNLKQLASKVSKRINNWVFEIKGEKESNWKLSYELHRPFITAMAKRMSQNKWKYPPYNRQKPMDIEELKQALFRHTIEVMNWNYTDIEDNDHLQSLSLNAMFIYYQLKNNEHIWV